MTRQEYQLLRLPALNQLRLRRQGATVTGGVERGIPLGKTLSKFVALVTLLLSCVPAHANNAEEFQRIADRGPVKEDTCTRFGGSSLPVTTKAVKTIINNATNVNGRLYHDGSVFVMYATNASNLLSLIASSYNLSLCRFPQ